MDDYKMMNRTSDSLIRVPLPNIEMSTMQLRFGQTLNNFRTSKIRFFCLGGK